VPGVRAPAFRSEAHRQSLAVAVGSHAHKDQEFIGARYRRSVTKTAARADRTR
jgi:hypothetical protein